MKSQNSNPWRYSASEYFGQIQERRVRNCATLQFIIVNLRLETRPTVRVLLEHDILFLGENVTGPALEGQWFLDHVRSLADRIYACQEPKSPGRCRDCFFCFCFRRPGIGCQPGYRLILDEKDLSRLARRVLALQALHSHWLR